MRTVRLATGQTLEIADWLPVWVDAICETAASPDEAGERIRWQLLRGSDD